MDGEHGRVYVEYGSLIVSCYSLPQEGNCIGGGGGGGTAEKVFFEAANILRLHMTFSKNSGGTCPPVPTALLLDKSIQYCMIVKDNIVKVK